MSADTTATRPLRSGELARRAQVSTDTLRYYERRRLLRPVPRSPAGYRLFPPEALERVRLIRGALSLGFSVNELAEILCERDGGGVPCRRVRQLAAKKLAALEAKLRDLQAWRCQLEGLLAEWDRLLRKTPRGRRAALLEAFARTHPTGPACQDSFGGSARGNRKQET